MSGRAGGAGLVPGACGGTLEARAHFGVGWGGSGDSAAETPHRPGWGSPASGVGGLLSGAGWGGRGGAEPQHPRVLTGKDGRKLGRQVGSLLSGGKRCSGLGRRSFVKYDCTRGGFSKSWGVAPWPRKLAGEAYLGLS